MTQAIIDCLLAAISEAIGLTAAWSLIRFLSRRGLGRLAESAGRRLLKRFLERLVSRLAGFIGWALIIALLLYEIARCAGWI
jgi:hypothetical protein